MNPTKEDLQEWFTKLTSFTENSFHPLVWITGEPEIGDNVHIGAFSELSSKGSRIIIGSDCDIAAFVSINCADSHKLCIGQSDHIDRGPIMIENNVFIGSHSVIKGGAVIGHHSVVASGTIVDKAIIPPYSLVVGNPMVVKSGYYLRSN